MIIIVDGYNVIKQALEKIKITPQERKRFIHLLSRYVRRKGHEIILVFDGGDSLYPYEEEEHGIKIVYSGYRLCADKVICEFLNKYKGYETVLVSSDRELKSFAKRKEIEAVTALFFYNKIKSILPEDEILGVPSGEVVKIDSGGDQDIQNDIDKLMLMASKNLVDKDAPTSDDFEGEIKRHKQRKKSGSSFTRPKANRKKNKLLEKL